MDAPRAAPARRFTPWLYLFSVLTLIAILGSSWGFDHLDLGTGGRLTLALVPVALWAAAIVLLVLTVRGLDEMQRRVQLEALAIAFPAAMLLGMTIEYLQKAGFVRDWSVGDVWPFMFLLYVPALALSWWRYR